MTLVLASTSRFRRQLFDRLGLPYEAVAPDYDEIEPPGLSPVDCAILFAREKAAEVARRRPGDLVVGADQALEFEGRLLRKPRDLDESAEQLLSLAGRWHRLHTAVALAGPAPGAMAEGLTTTELKVRPLTREQALRYAALDSPIGSVGGYTYEQHGTWLFDEVRGSDDSAIVGLPLWLLGRMLRDAGLDPLAG